MRERPWPTASLSRTGGRSRWVNCDGLRIHALEWSGTTPAVVIVPGITSPAATWAFVVRALGLPNRVIVQDLRGRGLSDTRDNTYQLDHYADDLLGLCSNLDLTNPVLVGHSMGARIVARTGRKLPNFARCLILVDPPLSGPGRPPYPLPLSFYIDARAKIMNGLTFRNMKELQPGWDEERLLDRFEWLPTCDVNAISESHRLFHEENFHEDWAKLTGKIVLVRGEESDVVTEQGIGELMSLNPNAVEYCVAKAGHMIPFDNLEGFVTVVRTVLESLKGAHRSNLGS